MTQSSLVLANQSGASFRAANNTAHQANAMFQAGASPPATTYAYQIWMDTGNSLWKQRDSSNTSFVTLASFSGTTHKFYHDGTVMGDAATLAASAVAQLAQAATFTKPQRGAIGTLTSSTSITPDFADKQNFTLDLGHNATINNPSGLAVGQDGFFNITQASPYTFTLGWGNKFYWDGGPPTLPTGSGTRVAVAYSVIATDVILAAMTGALTNT